MIAAAKMPAATPPPLRRASAAGATATAPAANTRADAQTASFLIAASYRSNVSMAACCAPVAGFTTFLVLQSQDRPDVRINNRWLIEKTLLWHRMNQEPNRMSLPKTSRAAREGRLEDNRGRYYY
jgi:hypothetical protein